MFLADHLLNQGVLEYLKKEKDSKILIAAPESVPDPYLKQGCHPDIVMRVWDQLGAALHQDCRCLVCGTPALVQPVSGIILAFCLGTQYCLRLTSLPMDEALKLGVKTSTIWAGGKITDAFQTFGMDWIFGSWKNEELDWCREVYEFYNQSVEMK